MNKWRKCVVIELSLDGKAWWRYMRVEGATGELSPLAKSNILNSVAAHYIRTRKIRVRRKL